MLADFHFCPCCNKIVVHKENECPECGIQLRAIDQDEAFLTGPRQTGPHHPKYGIVNLTNGDVLLDRFKIKNLLGEGRFGSVYLAEDILRCADVALKVIGLGSSKEDPSVLHLQHEMKTNKMIMDYSNVIRVYDFHLVPWEGSVLVFQSMEYAGGGTLRKWLAEHKADVETRRKTGLKFFKQACAGVRSIHQTGAFMLDLKPDNLLFCGDVIKVSDFGTAKFTETIGSRPIHLPDNGAPVLGTAEYMSPEQFLAPHPDDIDLRSDIYSLGIILYELLHPKCHPPFDGSYRRLQKLHVQVQAPRLPQTAEKLASIVARCLEKDPANRYQTVDELIAALEGKSLPEIGMKNSIKTQKEQTADILKKTWENASSCYAKGKFNEAAALVDEVLSAQSDHPQARRLKEELGNRFAQAEGFYREISTISEGSLPESIELLGEVISIYPDHPSGPLAQAKLAARVRQYRVAMKEGLNALQNEHWETALAWYQKAFRLHPETPYLSRILENLTQIKNYRNEMDAAIRQGNFDTALSLARLVDVRVEEMTARIPAFRA